MPPARITIRAATAADQGRVLDLWGRARTAYAHTPDTPEALAVLLDAGEQRLLDLGARRISVLVGADDDVATATWNATGYQRDQLIARLVKDVYGG